MVLLLLRILVTLLHAVLIFALAPLLMGIVTKFRARLLGRRGPPVLQPYLNLRKLIRKVPLVPDTATELYKIWPFVSFAAIAVITLVVPGFALNMVTARLSDFITLIGLFALARAATMLAGLETGFGFGGAGAGREALFSVFSEAALLVMVLIFVLIAGDPTINGMARYFTSKPGGISVSLGFALAATLAVALTETGRIPVDNPAGHLELGMVHEAMLLEYSGRYLALFHYTAMLRLIVWFSLLSTVFFPYGMARAGAVFSWPGGLLLWFVKLIGFAIALGLFEVSTAKMRVFRVPEFLGVALLLGLLSAIFLFVAAKLGG
jgi:formate hydrogenlyase subunit 4